MDETKPAIPIDKTQKFKDDLIFLISGVGCALLLSLALLGGAGALVNNYLTRWFGDGVTIEEVVTIESNVAAQQRIDGPIEAGIAGVEIENIDPEVDSGISFAPPDLKPEMSSILFSTKITEDQEPIEPASSFKPGITEIYATFEYSGLSPDDKWEQVWFHNDNELLHTIEQPGAESGVFSYSIKTGDEPLSPGEWRLELYVGAALLTSGSFVIEDTRQ